jgi:hypothetical protein
MVHHSKTTLAVAHVLVALHLPLTGLLGGHHNPIHTTNASIYNLFGRKQHTKWTFNRATIEGTRGVQSAYMAIVVKKLAS